MFGGAQGGVKYYDVRLRLQQFVAVCCSVLQCNVKLRLQPSVHLFCVLVLIYTRLF